MNILESIQGASRLVSWYFKLTSIKRIQVNYTVLLFGVITMAYFNDKQHRENYTALSNRNDIINNSREEEQAKYTRQLEFYTNKFNHLLEIFINQKEGRQEITNKNNNE
jgi:hypothetical protein